MKTLLPEILKLKLPEGEDIGVFQFCADGECIRIEKYQVIKAERDRLFTALDNIRYVACCKEQSDGIDHALAEDHNDRLIQIFLEAEKAVTGVRKPETLVKLMLSAGAMNEIQHAAKRMGMDIVDFIRTAALDDARSLPPR